MDGSEQCNPEACMGNLNTTEFLLLFIGKGTKQIQFRITPANGWKGTLFRTEP